MGTRKVYTDWITDSLSGYTVGEVNGLILSLTREHQTLPLD